MSEATTPGRISQQDQELAQAKHEAHLIATAYCEMVANGVPEDSATHLTGIWWKSEPA